MAINGTSALFPPSLLLPPSFGVRGVCKLQVPGSGGGVGRKFLHTAADTAVTQLDVTTVFWRENKRERERERKSERERERERERSRERERRERETRERERSRKRERERRERERERVGNCDNDFPLLPPALVLVLMSTRDNRKMAGDC
jgi:hypothetical protein